MSGRFFMPKRRKPVMPSFKAEYQSPQPRIEIILPPYDGSIAVWLTPANPGITSDKRHIVSNNLLSYSFSEAVDDLMGSFSFSVENEMITAGNAGKSLLT
jgi:hypothetical protein